MIRVSFQPWAKNIAKLAKSYVCDFSAFARPNFPKHSNLIQAPWLHGHSPMTLQAEQTYKG